MAWLVLTVIAAVVGTVGVLAAFGASTTRGKLGGAAACAAVVIIWLILTVALSVHTVGQRQVGIVHNFSGTITGKVDPGVAWTAPWQHIDKENVGLQREEFNLDVGNSAVSQDQQPIFARITINYKVLPSQVVNLWKTVGPGWKQTLLDSRVLQDFKEVTATYTAQEITTKREDLRVRTRERLVKELSKYDIDVVDVFVKNIGYSRAYSDAIDRKNRQVQAALQAQAKVAQSRAEADQKIATARGTAESTIIRAKGQAEAIRLRGSAIKHNPDVIKLEAIDKLNPAASVVICTGATCPAFLPQFTPAGKG